jgi:hypothetical protein
VINNAKCPWDTFLAIVMFLKNDLYIVFTDFKSIFEDLDDELRDGFTKISKALFSTYNSNSTGISVDIKMYLSNRYWICTTCGYFMITLHLMNAGNL